MHSQLHLDMWERLRAVEQFLQRCVENVVVEEVQVRSQIPRSRSFGFTRLIHLGETRAFSHPELLRCQPEAEAAEDHVKMQVQ